jgi:bifunctional non-homologous end joining protein LigD
MARTFEAGPWSKHFDSDARKVMRAACDLGLEGIVSKKADSPYRSGRQGSNPSAG